MNVVQVLEIPRFPLSFKSSSTRKPVYWKITHKNLPKKYRHITRVNKHGHILDENKNPILKNPGTAGKPKYISYTGNVFTSGLHHSIRSKMVHHLKDFYMPYVVNLKPFTKFPIIVEWQFHTTVDSPGFDMSNFWCYYKYFEDCLHMRGMDKWLKKGIKPVLPDDNIRYVTGPARPLLYPVEKETDRKFVFVFYHDNRKLIQQHPLWKQHNGSPP
jgi:hypothetical protein